MRPDFRERVAREQASSLLHWYPRIKDLLPCPRTVILELSDDEIWSLKGLLDGTPPGPEVIAKIKAAGSQIGYPLFLRSDQGSGKHSWERTCFVSSPESLLSNVVALVEWHEMIGLLGLQWQALVFREFLELEAPFVAFHGKMPVAKERRYFVRDGRVECFHPYWPPGSISASRRHPSLPADWKEQLDRLNTMDDDEILELTRMAEIFGRQNPGYWSVDFAKTRDGRWMMIDAARGEISFHWESCPNNPDQAGDGGDA